MFQDRLAVFLIEKTDWILNREQLDDFIFIDFNQLEPRDAFALAKKKKLSKEGGALARCSSSSVR